MKTILTAYLFILNASAFAQDSLKIEIRKDGFESNYQKDSTFTNYYIQSFRDTIWFTRNSDVVQCDYSSKIDKSHNHCTYHSFGDPMNGFFTICTFVDDIKELYKGKLVDGKYSKGTITRYFPNGTIQMTGQFSENAKIGFWTTYFSNGNVSAIFKFIDGADEPVLELEYDGSGNLVNSIDEEDEIRQRNMEE